MIKRIYIKKLIVSGIALFALFLVYFIPNNKNNELEITQEVEYIDTNLTTNTIFLMDSNNYLAMTNIVISNDDIENKAKELITALTKEEILEDKIPSGFKAIIPNGTKIIDLNYKDGLIKINFSKDLLDTSKDMETKIIEGLIYTLTSIDNVNKIMILIEGEILTKLPQSNIILPSTLDRNFGINKEYNIDSTNNINKTTIYYINKYNDKEYYVPVTKINNDNRSKIEIIIDELSSNNIYQTNLMSYLNSETKILSVNETDEKLTINFNESIFNDINTKDILEEVIYTICLSIEDNYNVKEVSFVVNNEEIYKNVVKVLE